MEDSFDLNDAQVLLRVLADTKETARTVAVVAGAYIEDYIGRVLRLRMPGLNSEERKKLFGAAGALGPVSVRIDLAKSLNLIDQETKSDLMTIARIRNKFAHNIQIESFDSPEIAPLCARLIGGREIISARMASPELTLATQENENTPKLQFYWCASTRALGLNNKIVFLEDAIRKFDGSIAAAPDGDFKEALKLARSMFRGV